MLAADTIAALSTPPGEGALAVIRITGPEALDIAARVFKRRLPAHRGTAFGRIADEDGPIDEGVAAVFHAPASYTGEDVVEISCHGGVLISARVLQAVLAAGARAAGPGEFTQRAFLNGKMDLTQAEAVMDLIRAQTPLAARSAAEQLRGGIGARITEIREALLDIVAHIEAYIDFPDEDIDPDTGASMHRRMAAALQKIDTLLATAGDGRILREGVRLAICGRPNAGKSSLLNRLLGFDRAIVSATPGTTRDTIEESLSLHGIPFRITDTAGLRETPDAIEREGVRRARETIEDADIVLRVIDAGEPAAFDDPPAAKDEVLVFNKVDVATPPALDGVRISCATGDGIPELAAVIVGRVQSGRAAPGESLAAINARHQACLQRAKQSLAAAMERFESQEAPEFVALDLRSALDAAGEVVGVVDTDDILGRIFGTFCIGK